jgi:hypothetical protein
MSSPTTPLTQTVEFRDTDQMKTFYCGWSMGRKGRIGPDEINIVADLREVKNLPTGWDRMEP